MSTRTQTVHKFKISEDLAGNRLDKALAVSMPDFSRSRIQKWIRQSRVRVAGVVCAQTYHVMGGECVEVEVDTAPVVHNPAQMIDLDIRFQDDEILVINKSVGLVVHPGAGNADHTLLNGLLALRPELGRLPRAGIVHRLDKHTSGLMVVACSDRAYNCLIEQLAARTVERRYHAIAHGRMISGGTVDAAIGRSRHDRRKMAIFAAGKPAITHYRVLDRYRSHTRIECRLETGRTHQIRVHMQHVGFPLVGDQVYGKRLGIPKGASVELDKQLHGYHHQALHAALLGFKHPQNSEWVSWESDPPADFLNLKQALEEDEVAHSD